MSVRLVNSCIAKDENRVAQYLLPSPLRGGVPLKPDRDLHGNAARVAVKSEDLHVLFRSPQIQLCEIWSTSDHLPTSSIALTQSGNGTGRQTTLSALARRKSKNEQLAQS